ncbi:MAG: hypothetical protein IT557_00125 [Alphaproteobacteria bacterium]|nr:hypothetical protein [Alphaproteobacteria bacterium]
MDLRAFSSHLSAGAFFVVAACAAVSDVTVPSPEIVAPPAGFAARLGVRIGDDFGLGSYPEYAHDLDAVFRYLRERHSVGSLMGRWDRVFATSVPVRRGGLEGPAYAFASNAFFTGDIVYAVATAHPSHPRAIYVWRQAN